MKKKKLIVLLIISVFVLFMPIRFRLLDGGTIEYKAILYKVSKVNKIINNNDMIGYAKGVEVEILGNKIYDTVKEYVVSNDKVLLDEVDGITMYIKDNTLTDIGCTVVIQDTNKDNIFGNWYRFDKKINGKWQELKPIIDNYGFTAMGYKVNEDGIIEFKIDWEWLYGKLDDGEYRIVKSVNHDKYFSVEFLIN